MRAYIQAPVRASSRQATSIARTTSRCNLHSSMQRYNQSPLLGERAEQGMHMPAARPVWEDPPSPCQGAPMAARTVCVTRRQGTKSSTCLGLALLYPLSRAGRGHDCSGVGLCPVTAWVSPSHHTTTTATATMTTKSHTWPGPPQGHRTSWHPWQHSQRHLRLQGQH